MFGKGTFKSSAAAFRPGVTLANNSVNNQNVIEKNPSFIQIFNEAEKTADSIKAVQLYNQFLTEANNQDEGN